MVSTILILLGRRTLERFGRIGRFVIFAGRALLTMLSRRPDCMQLLEQMYDVGIKSLPVIAAVAGFVGMSMMIQGHYVLRLLGAQDLVSIFIGLACLRELGPIVVGAMVASKSGSDMAAQIAVMRLRSQIDALEVMAIEPYWYLIQPRILAMLVMIPLLVVVANLTIILASLMVATWQLAMNPAMFLVNLFRYVGMKEMVYGIIKGSVFGLIISLICCYNGFYAEPSPEGVGRATNRSIVAVTAVAVLVNYVMSQVMYGSP